MSQTITAANTTTDPTTTPSVTAVADNDVGNATNLNAPLLPIMNFIAWLRNACALKNMGGAKITNLGNGTAAGDAVTYGQLTAQSVTRAQLPAVGQAVSPSSGAFSTTSGTPVDATNLSVSLTTTGRPVAVALQPDGTNGSSYGSIGVSATGQAFLLLLRDGSVVSQFVLNSGFGQILLPPPFLFLDVSASAATHVYKVQVALNTGAGPATVTFVKLVAYEL